MNKASALRWANTEHGAPLASFRDIHHGESLVVCGCGESLNLLEHPERFLTIGVNDVGRRFTPDYLVVINPRSQFAGDRFRHVEASRAKVLFTQIADLGVPHPNIVRFRLGRYGGTDWSDPGALHYTKNSPYLAVCLAAHMGARRIGVLGVDFTEHHFFGRTGVHNLARRLPQIDGEYARLADSCRARGIELVNLSPTSRLTALPRASLEAFARAAPASASEDVPVPRQRRVFFVNYRFLACGDVFATGLAHAAQTIGVENSAAWWDDPTLPEKIRAFGPDLVFVVHGRRFAQRWAGLAREWNTAVWLVDEPYEVDDTSRWSSMFQTVFVNDPATVARHRNAHPLAVCFDPSRHRDTGAGRDYQVGFVGGYNPVRERYLVRLAEEGLLSYVVGGPWRAPALQRLRLHDRSTPAETAVLYQRTRIVLNVFRSVHHFNRDRIAATALNPRIFEALACGALVLTEPRPALAAAFPELPTFQHAEDLVTTLRELLAEPVRADALLAASRARLAGEDYAARLANALELALEEPARSRSNAIVAPIRGRSNCTGLLRAPAGWTVVGAGVEASSEGSFIIGADARSETGLATQEAYGAVRLRFEVRLDPQCHFIAKIHHTVRGDRGADSYHLLVTPEHSYAGRHHVLLAPVALVREEWQRVEMCWNEGLLTVHVDGREACRCSGATIPAGYCFVGVTAGSAAIRALAIEAPPAAEPPPAVEGWSVQGDGVLAADADGLILSARPGQAIGLVSEAPANDIELAFSVRLDAHAHFIAKLHQQSPEDPNANSYHLISTPTRSYLARHGRVLADVRIGRGRWQRVLLRWVDQRLELLVNGRRVAGVADNLLQSGYCVVGITAGRAELRGLSTRDVSAPRVPVAPAIALGAQPRAPDPIPFTATPRRNLIYHVWPVRGEMWRWNLEQLRSRIDLFNGRRIVGIVYDERSEDPDTVRAMLDGHGCEFVVARNGPSGEGLTFPSMLSQVRSLDPNEVTFYAHAKGVKYEPAVPVPVRRWAQTQYRAALDSWPSVRAELERFAMTGSFKMLGRFRAHHYAGDWHYSGTYFWLRHALVFARDVENLHGFYGCVEAWPGVHFRREETGCLFMDDLRQLPYHEEFWKTVGDAAFSRWEAEQRPPTVPADLLTPPPFEGLAQPRLEQHPEEFGWLLDELVAASPRTLLCIGSMHGGVEWHIARRFRALGRDIHITAVDIEARPELRASVGDVRKQFGQTLELVIGDSTAGDTRARLGARYDAVFIDGDHGYRGARADVDFALTRGPRLVAVHDIADSDWHAQARCCVSRVWRELRTRHAAEQRIVGEWGGIGIIRP